MIAVIHRLQLGHCLFLGNSVVFRHTQNVTVHLRTQFFGCYAADAGILVIHADILQVVQLTEYTQLRELCDTGQEYELDITVTAF